jgi:hypothetical protein
MRNAFRERRFEILFGTMFGAWLGAVYAYFSQAINWIALPGVPLAPPGGDLTAYVLAHVMLGAVLGLVSSSPSNTWAGVVLGGVLGSLLSAIGSVSAQWGDATVVRTIILLLYTFLPLAVLLMPLAYLIRRGVDAQVVDPDRPYLWARRYLVPGGLTLVAMVLASFSLLMPEVRSAIRDMDQIIQRGMAAETVEQLPPSFQGVAGFQQNAVGPYQISYSDNPDDYLGPRPVAGELSQVVVFAQFENGYLVACIYNRATTVPNCTNQ